jgi:hypothetical protein
MKGRGMRRGRVTIFAMVIAAAGLGAASLLAGAVWAQASIVGGVVRQPFAADSGDRCRMGVASGDLGWHTDARLLVEVSGVVVDRPLPTSSDTVCGNDGRYTVATFTASINGVVVDTGTVRADNGRQEVALLLSGSRPIDLVVVEVCRVSRLPGPPTLCGTPQRYQRPITTTM